MASFARRTGPSEPITWVVDSLPELEITRNNHAAFDFVLCNGVLQHVPPPLLQDAIAALAELTKPSFACAIALRLGELDPGRPMFPLDPEEVCRFAANSGFKVESKSTHADPLNRSDVSWAMLILRRSG
jgi:hypothetical protein